MTGNKETTFKMRLTEWEKQKLKEYAENKGITMSQAIRQLCEEIFKGEEIKI